MIEYQLYDRLVTIVPNVYPGEAPLNYQRPCVIYNRIDTKPTNNLVHDDDTAMMTFQIDVYSTMQVEAIRIAREIRDSIKAWDDDEVHCEAYTTRQDMVDNTTDTQLFRVMQYFELFGSD